MRNNKTKRLQCIFLIGIMMLLFTSLGSNSVSADTGEDFDLRIDPGEYHFIDFSLSTGESIYVRFHVTYGDGIYFFIVDQDGYDDIMGGFPAETTYEESTYYAEDGQWRYIGFTARHSDTWYVWFSKVSGAPLAGSAATIEGHARKDTDGPIIQEFYVSEDPISGNVEVHYQVLDLGYPVKTVRLHVNGTPDVTITDPEQTHYTNGFYANGILLWDSTTSSNGNYILTLVAYDALGHLSTSNELDVTVSNGWWDYPSNLILIFGIIMLIGLAVCCRMTKR